MTRSGTTGTTEWDGDGRGGTERPELDIEGSSSVNPGWRLERGYSNEDVGGIDGLAGEAEEGAD